MTIIFALLCTVIGGYLFITDSERVRKMAENYLAELVGGPVTVESATLSIFEGLRLDDVHVYVDWSGRADSRLFSASSFTIEYNPVTLLRGRIEATRIVAIEPRLFFTEDVQTGKWNYERLRGSRRRGSSAMSISVLPEIVLRNAQVEYSRLKDKRRDDRGIMTIEGQLTPIADGKTYMFQFQSLGKKQGIGPVVRGEISLRTGHLSASMLNFEYGEDIKAMLPAPVHRWCEEHQLAGSLDVEDLAITQSAPGEEDPAFRAQIKVQGVKLTVNPEEWMGAREIAQLNALRNSFGMLRAAGLNSRGFVDRISTLTEPAPLRLHDVYALFVFTQNGITVERLAGKVEGIDFKITGVINGYSPSATAELNLRSLEDRPVEIPAAPRYITSMPAAVREVYDHFKPRGLATFWIDLRRAEVDARPQITGEINILDGNFIFDKFPYPVRNATGRILLECDEYTGHESLKLVKIRGRGLAASPNADSWVEINGEIGPFGRESGVDVIVSGQNIHSDPVLIAALPRQTRQALKVLDAPGLGEYPKFSGDFVCRIIRMRQAESHWIIETDIKLTDASGMLVAFPYPMSGVTGDLKIRDDHVEIVNAQMKRDDSTLRIDGKVSWGRPRVFHAPGYAPARDERDVPALRPDLKIVARNVPIDRDLLSALPPDRRALLERLGARGMFDLDGTVKVGDGTDRNSGELDFDLKIALRDGSFWPENSTFAVSQVAGALRLTPLQLVISNLSARRGQAQINASGSVSWPNEPPQLVLRLDAKDLSLDTALYQILPEVARRGWDQVNPEGSVDVSLSYSGAISSGEPPASEPVATGDGTAPIGTAEPAERVASPPGGFELIITPKQLAATPLAVPYRLEQLAGTVTVLPDKVIIKDVTGTHNDATIKLSGTGTTGPNPVWNFNITGKSVPVDNDLRRAVPEALADLIKSIEMKGNVDFDFSKLRVATSAPDPQQIPATTTSSQPALATSGRTDPIDVDFALTLKLHEASMNVGVPLEKVNGAAELTGTTRSGKLHELSGRIEAESLTLAERPAEQFRATLFKPPEHQAMQISRMEVKMAGGTMAGQVDWTFPDGGPSRYAVALVLRHADVKQLSGNLEQDIRGQLTASLNLEGTVDDPASRRGRGDVTVAGQQLYRIPLVLGLLQITELALPLTGPFRDGSARYSIDGNRVTFEQIELRSKEMLMQGDGYLDFGRKQVRMTFVTDARGWPKLPLLGDLMQGARNELLQIHVRGTLQEPKVSASSFNTFTTTIDEVFRGDQRESRRD